MSISFLNPCVTPYTALATKARARPCSARCSSEVRLTLSTPSFCSKETPFGMFTLSLPLGPCTSILSEAKAIFTPDGTGIGLFPIRDIFQFNPSNLRLEKTEKKLPNLTKQFAADVGLARGTAGHQTARRGQDADPQAANYRLH